MTCSKLQTIVALALVSLFGCQELQTSSAPETHTDSRSPEVKVLEAKLAQQTSQRLALYLGVHYASQVEGLAEAITGTPVSNPTQVIPAPQTETAAQSEADFKPVRVKNKPNRWRKRQANKARAAASTPTKKAHKRKVSGQTGIKPLPIAKRSALKDEVIPANKGDVEQTSTADAATANSAQKSTETLVAKASPDASEADTNTTSARGSDTRAQTPGAPVETPSQVEIAKKNQLKWLEAHPGKKVDVNPASGKGAADAAEVTLRAAGGKPLTPALINATVRRQQGALQACYERGLKRNPTLGGKLGLAMTIAANGSVSTVSVRNNSFSDAAVVKCMTSHVGKWRFPAASASVTVNKTFVFMPQS